MKITGIPVGTTMPRPDWNQTDPARANYILNKPDVVLYSEQTLAEDQKAQARANIGAAEDAELKAAIATEKAERQAEVATEREERKADITLEREERQADIALERARVDELVAMRGADGTTEFAFFDNNISGTIKHNGVYARINVTIRELTIPSGGFYQTGYCIPFELVPFEDVELKTAHPELSVTMSSVDDNGAYLLVEYKPTEPIEIDGYFENVACEAYYMLASPYIAELADLRVGLDGEARTFAGDAVREQMVIHDERIYNNEVALADAIMFSEEERYDTLADAIRIPVKELRESVATLAESAIANEATGSVITLKDSSNRELQGLKIYGTEETATAESVTVKVSGKNLFNHVLSKEPVSYTVNCTLLEVLKNGVILQGNEGSTPGTTLNSCGWYTPAYTKMLPLKNGEVVTISADYTMIENAYTQTPEVTIFLRGAADHTDGKPVRVSIGEKKRVSITYTVKKTGDYRLVFTLNSGKVQIENVQVEYGSAVSTTYEPYKEPQTLAVPTPNGLPGIGDLNDELNFVNGTYTSRFRTIEFTGKEDFQPVGKHFAFYIGSGSNKAYENSDTVNALCNCFPGTSRNDIEKSAIGLSASYDYIRFIDTERFPNGDKATVKQFFADRYAEGNPVIVQYVLAKANWVETELTAEQMVDYATLHTYKPNTTITTDRGNGLSVEYVADTKAYIDNKFTELQNAILASGANV